MSIDFNAAGLGSGFDWQTVVDQLIYLEKAPIRNLESRRTEFQTKQTAWQELETKLNAFRSKAAQLNSSSYMSAASATSSDTDMLTASATGNATPGNYEITIHQLAQAHKISSDTYSSQSTALELSGDLIIGGRAVTIETTDTLVDIRSKINAVNTGDDASGVTATILQTTEDSYKLVLARDDTGDTELDIRSVGSNDLLQSLNLTTSGTTSSDDSAYFSSSTENIADMLSLSTPAPSGTVQINGTDVDIDFSSDTLEEIKDKLDAVDGVNAEITTDQDSNGDTIYRIETTGITTMSDSENVLESLAFLKETVKNENRAAQEAQLTVDGETITRDSNSISDLITGVTLNLLEADETETLTVTVNRDTSTVTSNIQEFVNSYNELISYIREQREYDPASGESGPLQSNSTIRNIQTSLQGIISSQVSGLEGDIRALSQIGISTTSSGTLSIDSTELAEALEENPTAVSRLFMTHDSSTSSNLSYIIHQNETQGGTYDVNITQVASQAETQGDYEIDEGGIASDETLTFTVGDEQVEVELSAGDSLSAVIQKINAAMDDAAVNITASSSGNTLVLTADSYGSNHNFSVVSDVAADPGGTSTGIGSTEKSAEGLDLQGNINGEEATGSGRFLTAADGTTAQGLKIMYTGSTTGDAGSISLSRGILDQFEYQIEEYTDAEGLVETAQDSLEDSIEDINDRIDDMERRIVLKTEKLEARFQQMELLITQLHSQQSYLQGLSAL